MKSGLLRVQERQEFLPFALPDYGAGEFDAVRQVLESGWITTGSRTREFEAEFAKAVGAKHAIAQTNHSFFTVNAM